jgi:cadmium resistance protein CadD (predicted permease)
LDYLNDDKLEEMGYIKEIDTLAIVEKASKITEKKRNKLLVISFTLMIITSVLGQGLFVILFGGNNLVKLGIKIYIFVLLVVSLILIDKREESLC